jgi:hypothetical protein
MLIYPESLGVVVMGSTTSYDHNAILDAIVGAHGSDQECGSSKESERYDPVHSTVL